MFFWPMQNHSQTSHNLLMHSRSCVRISLPHYHMYTKIKNKLTACIKIKNILKIYDCIIVFIFSCNPPTLQLAKPRCDLHVVYIYFWGIQNLSFRLIILPSWPSTLLLFSENDSNVPLAAQLKICYSWQFYSTLNILLLLLRLRK